MALPEGSQEARLDALARNLTGVRASLKELEKTRRTMTRLQIGFTVVLVTLFIGFGSLWYAHVRTFRSANLGLLVTQQLARSSAHLGQMAFDVGAAVAPVYLREFNRQAPGSLARIGGIAERELAGFVAEMPEYVLQRAGTFAEGYRDHIQAYLPGSHDETLPLVMLQNLRMVVRESVFRVLASKFQGPHEALAAIQGTLNTYQRRLGGRVEPDLERKLIATCFELMGKRLARGYD